MALSLSGFGGLLGRLGGVPAQFGERAVEDGRQRYGDGGAGDPGHDPADREGHDDGEWMEPDQAADDERLQDVIFQLLLEDQDAEQDDGEQQALRTERYQHGEAAGDDDADDRQIAGQEDQRGEGHHQGDAHDGEHDRHHDRVDRGDDRGAHHVLRQGAPGGPARRVHPWPRRPEGADQPTPDAVAVLEQEERHEDHEDDARHDLGRHGGAADEAASDLLPAFLQLLQERLHGLV